MLETFKSSFDVDFENKAVLTLLKGVEFEAGASEAVQGAMALQGYSQIVHELTLLQLFCRASKAC